MTAPPDFTHLREAMVESQLVARGVLDARVLAAMRAVPRERFIATFARKDAYADAPLAIESNQSISQPYVVAFMMEAARLEAGDRVLEVGTGSGYAAAVLGCLVRRVLSMERDEMLAALAEARLRTLGYANVEVRIGDGSRGLERESPFDAILVAASGPYVAQVLKEQLQVGGRLVMPVGAARQTLFRITRRGANRFDSEELMPVRFVPLVGEQGFNEDARDSPGGPASPVAERRRPAK